MVVKTIQEQPFQLTPRHGTPIYGLFRDTGADPVGVFLHGFRSTLGGQKSVALAEHANRSGYSWLRFDLSGHGRSGGEFQDFRLSRALDDALAVLDMLAGRRVILVGSSLGGWLSVLAVGARPDLIAGMLLIAPAFNFLQSYFGLQRATELAKWRERGECRFEDLQTGEPFTLPYDVLVDARAYDVLSEPVPIPCPVRILHGADDPVVPPAVSERFVDQAPSRDIQLEIISGGGHGLNESISRMRVCVDELWIAACP